LTRFRLLLLFEIAEALKEKVLANGTELSKWFFALDNKRKSSIIFA